MVPKWHGWKSRYLWFFLCFMQPVFDIYTSLVKFTFWFQTWFVRPGQVFSAGSSCAIRKGAASMCLSESLFCGYAQHWSGEAFYANTHQLGWLRSNLFCLSWSSWLVWNRVRTLCICFLLKDRTCQPCITPFPYTLSAWCCVRVSIENSECKRVVVHNLRTSDPDFRFPVGPEKVVSC